jgi:hypothetical protein
MSIPSETALRTRTLALVTLAAIAGCTDKPTVADERCSTQNCMTLMLNCHLRLEGSPDTTCVAAAVDAGYDTVDAVLQYCTDACVAANLGALVQCIAQNFPGNTCQDINLDAGGAGELAAIVAVCGGNDAGPCGSSCASCQQQCDQADSSCNALCPLSDAGACFACNYDCNQRNLTCLAACPTN